MFFQDGILRKSSLFDVFTRVCHGFSAREGGVSTLSHTATLNLAKNLGDDDETVVKNTEIFARALSGGTYGVESVVMASQIHSAKVRILTRENCGEGGIFPPGEPCDGFVTDERGVMPIVRTADCVPILLCGVKKDGAPVIGAVHAGWRGTVSGIAAEAVRAMISLGCGVTTIRAAIGAHIGYCCYEVGEDFYETVRGLCGADFAARHVTIPTGETKHHANLTSMNLEILADAGVMPENIDASEDCTMCLCGTYYSHRATGGRRGVMGAGIVIR